MSTAPATVTAMATAPPQPPPPPPLAAAATGARPSTANGGDAPVPPAPQMDHAALLLVAGARLRYSQETTARAVAFFYELRQSFERDETELLAATCLFLAGKSAETPRRVRSAAWNVLPSSVESRSFRLIFGRVAFSRRVFDAGQDTCVRTSACAQLKSI
jgi:hypothetical protein